MYFAEVKCILLNVYGLAQFHNRFRKDMILSDLVILVASRTRFGSAKRVGPGKGNPLQVPTILYEDNTTCIAQLKAEYVKGDRTKHISPKFFFTHDIQERGVIDIQQV